MRLSRDFEIVPVLTFHSVGTHQSTWIWNHLSESAEVFERLLQKLIRWGYRTVSLDQLYSHMAGQEKCEPKSIVLAFDDGYLDNWVTVYPLLKKYGMRGVVYINPEFVEPGENRRPTSEDFSDARSCESRIEQMGFMNWGELKFLDSSGVLDVQSHTATHTWYFTGPNIIDCYSPQTAQQYPWLMWNARPERKPYYLSEDQSAFVPWGTPVFENEKAIIARRFFPDEELINDVVGEIAEKKGESFFDQPNWRDEFRDLVLRLTRGGTFPGEYESDEALQSRIRRELSESKSAIEDHLEKRVHYVCWPGGGVNAIAKTIAKEVGYHAWTLPSHEQPDKRNKPNTDPAEIKRLTASRNIHFRGRMWGQGSENITLLELLSHQRSSIFVTLRNFYKIAVAMRIAGRS